MFGKSFFLACIASSVLAVKDVEGNTCLRPYHPEGDHFEYVYMDQVYYCRDDMTTKSEMTVAEDENHSMSIKWYIAVLSYDG